MPHYLTKILVLIFAIGAALMCDIAFAATATEGTVTPADSARGTAATKPSRQLYLFLPDAAIRASQKPFSRYQNEKSFKVVSHKETKNRASPPAPELFPSQETRPTTSLMIGWLPVKEGTNTTGLYQPGQYQYASTPTEAGCRAMDRTANNAEDKPDGGGNGLHLPAGWLLGMCLHY